MRARTTVLRLAATLLLVAAGACKPPPEPLKLKAIELGTAVDKQNRVESPTRSFAPDATVYASIATEGGGTGKLTVQWLAGTHVVASQTQDVNPSAPARFVFHFASPGGWPAGTNRIMFSLNDGEKHTAEFQVR
jgi:hypothetical protein